MQLSTGDVVVIYIWLAEAAICLITAAFVGAEKKRPELTLVVAPLLIICPLIALNLGKDGGTVLGVVCALGATWLPLLGVKAVPTRQAVLGDRWPTSEAWSELWEELSRGVPPLVRPRPPTDDPYAVLGVPPGASQQEIRAAWRRRAAESHPDKVAHLGPEARQAAHETMAKINKAYETLRRPDLDV
jgi:hypothetical protein